MTLRSFATALALVVSAAAADAAPFTLNYLGSYSVPKGTRFGGEPLGGISGLQMMKNGSFTALSDQRGNPRRPGSPRFYNLTLDYDRTGFHGVTINSQTLLKDKNGVALPRDRSTIDPEAIRLAPGGGFYISSEGNYDADKSKLVQPRVFKVDADGKITGEVAIPKGYNYTDNTTGGARNNRLLEAMAVGKDGAIYVANEEALLPDGARTSAQRGAPVRVAKLDPNGQPIAQYAYLLPKTPLNGAAGSVGLVEMLAMKDGGFLTMERSWNRRVGNTVSLNYATIGDATNILNTPSLKGAAYTAMTRETVLFMKDDFKKVNLDNMEAMTFGKRLKNGNLSLIIASDDNFNPRYQRTLFMAFEIAPTAVAVPLPAGLPLLAIALGGLVALRRRA